MEEGVLALRDAHLWLRFSCFGRVGSIDKWQTELTGSVNSEKSELIAVMIPSRRGGQGSNKGILSAYSEPEFF